MPNQHGKRETGDGSARTITNVHPLLRPGWLAGHVLAVAGIVAFVLLGMWQLRRHDEKTELRDAVAAAQQMSSVVPIDDVALGSFRRVSATGEYLPEAEAKVLRSRRGVSGYEVLTPLLLADGSALLVDRGWAALDVDHRFGGATPAGTVVVEGLLWPGEGGGDGDLGEFVKRVDPRVFAAATGLEFRPEFLVLAIQSPPTGVTLQIPDVGEISLGLHLGYAGQWFLFAAVVLVGYPILLRRSARRSPRHRG